MDRLVIINKLVLILFVVVTFIHDENLSIPWAVLSLLIYFCLNIGLPLLNKRLLRLLLISLTILLCIVAFINISPYFIIFIPMATLEGLANWKIPRAVLFICVLIPVFYIHSSIQAIYILIAIYSCLFYILSGLYIAKMTRYETKMDQIRANQDRMLKKIHEQDAYRKQSAYTFKLEERNRISQEIHDDIGHAITGALIQMEATKKLLHTNPAKAEELLQNAIGITQTGIERIRFTLKNMKPTTEQVGVNRLKLSIDAFAADHDRPTFLTYTGDMDRLTAIQWKVILENVTEALTNSLKYARGSTRIDVDVRVLNKLVRVEVQDDGDGAESIKKGLGIIGMEERSATIDGKVIVDGKDGFSVTTLLPIDSEK